MSESVDTYNKIDQNLLSAVNDNKQSIMSSLKNKTNVQSVHAHVFMHQNNNRQRYKFDEHDEHEHFARLFYFLMNS